MVKYKNSRFIYTYRRNEDVLIFNTLYGYLDIISADIYLSFINNSYKNISNEIIGLLQERQYLIPIDVDENRILETLRKDFNNERNKQKYIYFCFSYSCNLRCSYCFEQDMKSIGDMSITHINKIINYIEANLKNQNLEFILYGGEPLLPKNIEKIRIVLDYASKCNIQVKIITNGINIEYYLDVLIEYKNILDHLLITVDGDKVVHNKTRKFINGIGTYDIIQDNLKTLANNSIPYELRVNLGKDNSKNIKKMFESNELFRENIVNIHTVENNSNSKSIKEKLKDDSVSNLLLEIKKYSKKADNIRVNSSFLSHLFNHLSNENVIFPAFDSCGMENILLFDSSDRIYNCTEACGNEKFIVGNLSSDYSETIEKDFSFMADLVCIKCNLSPICGGGCALNRLQRKDLKEVAKCNLWNKNNNLMNTIFSNLIEESYHEIS